jgi:serine/threonine protein kinase
MKKAQLIDDFGVTTWKERVLIEQQLQAKLHHPLIVNLAYSFQNSAFLILITDVCPGGDLSPFAIEDQKLTPEQVRFVGTETCAVIAYLHSKNILYRDLKPENLLLDAEGHVRLCDMGLAMAGKGGVPTTDKCAGTLCYMAPEAKRGKKYGAPADWYTVGVLMYELTEKDLPFGGDPPFNDYKKVAEEDRTSPPLVPPHLGTHATPMWWEVPADDCDRTSPPWPHHYHSSCSCAHHPWSPVLPWQEWRKPVAMITAQGTKDEKLLDLVKRLTDWDAKKRLGNDAQGTSVAARDVKGHPYWQSPEWQLVEMRRLPSPLKMYMHSKMHQPAADNRRNEKKRRAAMETAQQIAKVEEKSAVAHEHEGETRGPNSKALEQERLVEIDGWNFASPHAVEQEYVETIASSVSLI